MSYLRFGFIILFFCIISHAQEGAAESTYVGNSGWDMDYWQEEELDKTKNSERADEENQATEDESPDGDFFSRRIEVYDIGAPDHIETNRPNNIPRPSDQYFESIDLPAH